MTIHEVKNNWVMSNLFNFEKRRSDCEIQSKKNRFFGGNSSIAGYKSWHW